MTSLLRQIVAGPRAPHESKLDLCYVTDEILVTSGPAVTYPHVAYRNPLPRLLSFLDSRHGKDGWKIFEFRAEGTGYADDDVRGKVEHFPWPDHHPPPFPVLLDIMVAMKNWLGDKAQSSDDKNKRVAVLHCKAGKGRSGTVASSFLVICRGWKVEDALARFTERRMRVGWGDGVSILSQRRWVSYVGRWAAALEASDGKSAHWYDDVKSWRVKIKEVRVWGMREGGSVLVRGYFDNGKRIGVLASWKEEDGETTAWDQEKVLDGEPIQSPGSVTSDESIATHGVGDNGSKKHDNNNIISAILWGNGSIFGTGSPKGVNNANSRGCSTQNSGTTTPTAAQALASGSFSSLPAALNPAPPTMTIFRPDVSTLTVKAKSKSSLNSSSSPVSSSIITPTLEVNICIVRRHRNLHHVVTATAHSWFDAFFEGGGLENGGKPKKEGTYKVNWDAMDGVKGSTRRGVRAVERMEVDWEIIIPEDGHEKIAPHEEKTAVMQEEKLEKHGKIIDDEDPDVDTDPVLPKEKDETHGTSHVGDVDSDAEEGVKTYGVEGETVIS